MSDWLPELGQYGGPIVAGGLALKYGAEAWSKWRKGRRDGTETTMSDAATTNKMLLDALKVERADNARKDQRIDQLEQEVDTLRGQFFRQQRQYEQELAELRDQLGNATRQLADVTRQLDGLQARIHANQPKETT